MVTDRENLLGEKKVLPLLIKFSIPAIIGMMVNALYNVVDRIFIGQGVGTLAIAGLAVAFPVMLVMMALAMLVGIGSATLISIRLGEKKRNEAERLLGQSVSLLLIIFLSYTVISFIFMKPLLNLFGASDQVLPYAAEYLSIILFGSTFFAFSMGLNHSIRAEGNPKIAMWTMLIGAILNIILDPIFIFGLNMGIRGAALATVIAQSVSAIWVLRYFMSGKSVLKLRWINMRLCRRLVFKIFAIGSAPFVMQLMSSILVVLLNQGLRTHGGDIAISALGIVHSISMFIFMPVIGINQGAQPIIGFNYGARQMQRVREALFWAILFATCIVTAGFLVTRLIPEQLIRLFNQDDLELLAVATRAMYIFMFMMPVVGFQVIASGTFQALGKPRKAMFLSLSRQVILLIPLILILPNFLGLDGVWMSIPIADVGSCILAAAFLIWEVKHWKKFHTDVVVDTHTPVEKRV